MAAAAIFRLATTGNATIIVPVIMVAEFYFLSATLGQPVSLFHLLASFDAVGEIELSDLGKNQLERLDQFPDMPEMRDRLIAAEAAFQDAPDWSAEEQSH